MDTAVSTASRPDRAMVVIVNYRAGPLVVNCLRSLEPEVAAHPQTEVVVVDNQSGDGSHELIAESIRANGWSGWARAVLSPRNGGFAYGNNVAVRAALATQDPPAYFWLLNPDTEVRPGALGALIDIFRRRPEVGIAGGQLEEEEGMPWPFAFRFPSISSEFERGMRLSPVTRILSNRIVVRRMHDREEPVDWVAGASMMVRREVFETVGLMDEGYFLYFEETDFCLQARRAGWSTWYVPNSRVMHISGASTGVTQKNVVLARMPKYWFESRRRFFVKNFGRAYAMGADLAWIVSFCTYIVRKRIQRKKDSDPPRLLADFIRNSSILKARLE